MIIDVNKIVIERMIMENSLCNNNIMFMMTNIIVVVEWGWKIIVMVIIGEGYNN